MGPNSNRARKNNAINLNAPARARFSNWRPPSKNKSSGRGSRDDDERKGGSNNNSNNANHHALNDRSHLGKTTEATKLTVIKPEKYIERLPTGYF